MIPFKHTLAIAILTLAVSECSSRSTRQVEFSNAIQYTKEYLAMIRTPEYRECERAITPIFEQRGQSEDSVYDFCVDADADPAVIDPFWLENIRRGWY